MSTEISGNIYMSVVILRQAVEKYLTETGFTYKELAEKLDWWQLTEDGKTKADTKKLTEILRVRPTSHAPMWVKESIAVPIIRAIGRAPNEFGF